MKKITGIILMMTLFTRIAFGVTATPDTVVFEQPDKTRISVMIKGDERTHWYESLDKYTLIFNDNDYLVYAYLNDDGNLTPSQHIATNIDQRSEAVKQFLSNIGKNLRYSVEQRQIMKQIYNFQVDAHINYAAQEKTGSVFKYAVALVAFSNKNFTYSYEQFEVLLNQVNYQGNQTGSVRDYFRESSYNQFDIEFTITHVLTAPQNSYYYAGTSGTQNVSTLVKWALEAMNSEVDFSEFDNNNDGWIDGFHFIFAGQGKETGGGNGTIWSHKGSFNQITLDGKKINSYSCTPELRNNTSINTIGVVAHEVSHGLGAPDFYDIDYEENGQFDGTGSWDIMANGSYNGTPSGNNPAHHNMWQKIDYGWVTPTELEEPQYIRGMPNSSENPVAYTINTGRYGEYFILENRQKIDFNSSVPGAGLLILRITGNDLGHYVNNTHPQKCYFVYAGSNIPLPTGAGTYGNINSSSCPFPGPDGDYVSFTDATNPSMKAWNGSETGKPITHISMYSDAISFSFMGAEEANPEIQTLEPSEVDDNSANFHAFLTAGTEPITKTGYYYKKVEDEEWKKKYAANNNMKVYVFNLDNHTHYVYKAFVATETDTIFGEEIQFFTSPLGIPDNFLEDKFEVYATGSTLYVNNLEGMVVDRMELYDLTGKRIMTNKIYEGNNSFSLNVNTGIYITKIVTSNNDVLHKKVLINAN